MNNHGHLLSNYLLIQYSVLPAVQIRNMRLMKKPTNVQMAKNEQIGLGLPPANSVRIGNKKLRVATRNQLVIVVQAMIQDWTTSEMYIQIIGPVEKENKVRIAMNRNITKKDLHVELFQADVKSQLQSVYDRAVRAIAMDRAPHSIFFFRPNHLTAGMAPKQPARAIVFMKIGKDFSKLGIMEPTTWPEQAMMEPIPTICCWIDKWKQRYTAILLLGVSIYFLDDLRLFRIYSIVSISCPIKFSVISQICVYFSLGGVDTCVYFSLEGVDIYVYEGSKWELAMLYLTPVLAMADLISSKTSATCSGLQITESSSLACWSFFLIIRYLGVSYGKLILMLQSWIREITIGKPKTKRQQTVAGRNNEKKKDSKNDEVIPNRQNI